MVITVDQSLDEPLYQQIRAQIIEAIASGELTPGDSLPSVRSLASDLGINLHTVNRAYAILRDEGYLAMRGRAGAVVVPGASAAGQDDAVQETLRRAALAFKARGGSRDSFEAEMRRVLDTVYKTTVEQ